MEDKQIPKWVPWVGYPLFFIVTFVIFLHVTLPWSAIQSRMVEEAHKAGYTITVTSMGPSLGFGMTAKGVMVTPNPPPGTPADAPAKGALFLDAVTLKPSFFPSGVSISAKALGGNLNGSFAEKNKTTDLIELHGKELDLSRAGLKPLTGFEFDGKLTVDASLVVNPADFSKTTGDVKLYGKDLALVSGTAAGMDLPKANLGTLDVKLKADSGKATIDTLALNGGDIEAKGEGDITLALRPQTSQLHTKLEFKPNEEWLKRDDQTKFVKTGLSFAGRPNSSGFYAASLDGTIGNPRATMKN